MGRIVRVGLTGGIGSGKSAVADVWRKRGATIIDADVLAREAVAPGSRGLREVALRWPAVIAADGTLDRPALARIVFDNAAERAVLNGIVHRACARSRKHAKPKSPTARSWCKSFRCCSKASTRARATLPSPSSRPTPHASNA